MTRPCTLLLVCLTLSLSAVSWAEGLASSASGAGSASVGSLSDSVQGSSNSSTRDKPVAAGDYRVTEIAELAAKPGMLRLTLQPVVAAPDAGTWWLDLPQNLWREQALGPGDLISARPRPYGLEIARADTRQAFYLLLADAWRHDIEPRALTL